MARIPQNSTKRQLTRPSRTAVSFKDEDDVIQNEEDEDVELASSEDSAEMLAKFLAEYKKREAKKTSARSAAFINQKNDLYATARKAANDLAREGIACLEEGKMKLLALKREEVSADKYSKDVVPLWHSVEDSIQAILSIYPTGVEDLFPRRSKSINTASEMLRLNPGTRSDALEECVETANGQLYQSKLEEKNAADASRLIKHYKNLLLV